MAVVTLSTVPQPPLWYDVPSVTLNDDTLQLRKSRVLANMRQSGVDTLIVYADKEHGGNFEYLTGFIPRFEEALLVLHRDGEAALVLGNENLKLAGYARLENRVIHAPWFSLPNQPMDTRKTLAQLLQEAGVAAEKSIGLAGWKLFTGAADNRSQMFDLPAFIVDALRQAAGPQAKLSNATGIFIDPAEGARITNNANELAHYEYGANLASTAILTALNAIAPGKTEKQIGALLAAEGQPNSVVMIAATGDRFANAGLYPGDKVIQRGDKFSLTTSFKGGDMYALIEQVLPKAEYHWHLNPGHLVADEEWLCSPIGPHSAACLQSGMILQIDIIPSRSGYGGASIEDTVALADGPLRQALAQRYPQLWQRIVARRLYIGEQLGIVLPEEVLPFSSTVGYLRPWLLSPERALVCAPY